jgi:hypothetical protein
MGTVISFTLGLLYPWDKSLDTIFIWGWVGAESGLGSVEKSLLTLLELNQDSRAVDPIKKGKLVPVLN